jgi:3',5'-cyclic AMP phosphodiesterase CpdA
LQRYRCSAAAWFPADAIVVSGHSGRVLELVRIVQISDTHIGQERARFMCNWAPVLDWINRQNPSLILHGGDITLDGADEEDDFALCAQLAGALPAPFRVVPGNHDVGLSHNARQTVDGDRLARWRRHFGADRWLHDVEGWRLLGFNSMILGSGLPAEEEQFSWLATRMESAAGRRIGWLCHQPLFIHGYNDPDNGYWSVAPEPRRRLEALSRRFDIGLVCSGHLHLSREMMIGRTHYVWCPSTAFTVGPTQPAFPGDKVLGAVNFDFEGSALHVQRVHLAELTHSWIEDVAAEVYPRK